MVLEHWDLSDDEGVEATTTSSSKSKQINKQKKDPKRQKRKSQGNY